MTECRLNNVMLLHCHKDIADGIDLTNIAKSFVSVTHVTLGDKITLEVLFNASLWLFCDHVYTTFAVAFNFSSAQHDAA